MSEYKNLGQTETSETQIARLTVLADTRYLSTVVDLVSDIAKTVGLSEDSAQNLDAVLVEVFQNVINHGYEGDTTQSIDVIVSKRAHSLVVSVEDKGLPFDYRKLEHGEDPRFSSFLSKGYADRVHFVNFGQAGNCVELIKDLPSTDIRDQADPAEHQAALDAEEAHPEEALSVRMVRPDEAVDLARLVYRCYGYTYPGQFIYYPEQVEARLRAGLMKSCAVYNSRGEMVGHLALSFDRAGDKIAESGRAVVDPRYRGHGLFERMKHYLLDYAAANQIAGVYGEAVTVHPYSQKGSLALGGHEVGFLLGSTPGTMSFRKISDREKPRRQSLALMYTPVLKGAQAPVFSPEAYRPIIGQIYNVTGIERKVMADQNTSVSKFPQLGRVTVSVRPDIGQAFLVVDAPGRNTVDEIRFHLKQLCLNRIDCIYADLPLFQEGAGPLAAQIRGLGFFFGGVIPELRAGDVLRLQYLNNVEISPDDISVASDFGRTLLSTILEDRAAVTA